MIIRRRTFLKTLVGAGLLPIAMQLAPGSVKPVQVVEEISGDVFYQTKDMYKPQIATFKWKKNHFEFTDFSGKTTKHNYRGTCEVWGGSS